ncbi:vanadium-dependent haloperoxidase, partial [Candidatus Poribacteria bacterium]|nr:vanadium-dependent haloperoxidase [Candidatus Poribacteria bacterium]
CQLAKLTSAQKGYGLDDDVKMYFLLTNAQLDSSIVCWEAKYVYDYIRPISAIHNRGDVQIQGYGGPGQGTVTLAAKDWIPYQLAAFVTPPFPEYTSGHATFGASWAECMRLYTGSDAFGESVVVSDLFIDGRVIEPVTLTWPTYSDAADEDGVSRLYGGLHFRDAWIEGAICGRHAAGQAFARAQQFFNGTARPAPAAFNQRTGEFWVQHTIPGTYTAPRLEMSDGSLGLFINGAPGNVYGAFETVLLDPMPAGRYKTSFALNYTTPEGARRPEMRVRVFAEDNSFTAMAVHAQTVLSADPRPTVDVYWESDGATRFKAGVDILAFAPDASGGFQVTGIENVRLN